jgi:chemotaxis protein MotB
VRSAVLWKTKSNFELAAYRALNVLLKLEADGVPSLKMYIVSWGEHKPLVANDTNENKQKNRRVEFFIYEEAKLDKATDEKPKGK